VVEEFVFVLLEEVATVAGNQDISAGTAQIDMSLRI